MIDNIVSSYRSSASELSNISSNILTLCDVLEVLDKRLKLKRSSSFGATSIGTGGIVKRSLTHESKHLASLQLTTEETVLSESQACLQNVLDKCWGCLLDIQRLLEPFRSGGGGSVGVLVRFRWMRKKSDVQHVMANLESCKSTLSLTLLVLRYCAEDEEQIDPKDIALAIQKQAEQLKSEKDQNYAFVMQRYLDCASSTIGSPKSTLVQIHGHDDDVKSFVLDDVASTRSTDFEIDSEDDVEGGEDTSSSLDSFSIPRLRSESSQSSLLSVTVYQKVGNERKEQRRRKRQSKDSGCIIEDDDISILSRESVKWQPFLSLGYKLEWYRRNFRPDLNGRLSSIQQVADTCEFNIQELLAGCKPPSRPITPMDALLTHQNHNHHNQLQKKSSRHLLSRPTPLKPREEELFRGIVRIQKALANLSTLRSNALKILSAAPVLIRTSSVPITIHTKSTATSTNNTETPLRPYVLDALQILLTIHTLSERLHHKLQELTSHRDQTSKSSILSRLSLSNDISRFEHTKRTFSNIEAKISLTYAQERYSRAKELWEATHDVIYAALEAEFFFFDDMDRILSAAIAEPLPGYNKLKRSNSLGLEIDMSDNDVNRGYSALVASAERQKSYTLIDHKLRGILHSAKSEVMIAEGKVDFVPVNGTTMEQVLGGLEEEAARERKKLEEVFKYLNEYVCSYVAGAMGRLDVGMARFGERLFIPLRKTAVLE